MGRYSGKKCRLISMFWLTAFFFLVEITIGYATNSMALVADSFHMLSDIAAIIVAFLSVKMSPKKWSKNTFGWARAEVLGALVNAVFLAAICFSISVEAVKRFVEVEEVREPKLIVAVGSLGLLVNLIGLFLLHEHGSHHSHSHSTIGRSTSRLTQMVSVNNTDDNENDESFCPPPKEKNVKNSDSESMNMRGIFLHVMADALGSVIVIASALVVWLTEWEFKYYMDPALSIVMVFLILRSLWPLLRDSSLILLQTVPTHIHVDAIEKKLLDKVDGVLAVHEFHIWQLAGDRIIASAHIRCRNLSEYMKIAEKVKEFFHNEGIHSTTIQPEFIEVDNAILKSLQEVHSDTGTRENHLGLLHGNSSDIKIPDEVNQVAADPVLQTTGDCVLDCPKTDKPCTFSTCCGPSKQGRESPTLGESQYLCRQRTCASTLSLPALGGRGELSEMERGALLESSHPVQTAREACV